MLLRLRRPQSRTLFRARSRFRNRLRLAAALFSARCISGVTSQALRGDARSTKPIAVRRSRYLRRLFARSCSPRSRYLRRLAAHFFSRRSVSVSSNGSFIPRRRWARKHPSQDPLKPQMPHCVKAPNMPGFFGPLQQVHAINSSVTHSTDGLQLVKRPHPLVQVGPLSDRLVRRGSSRWTWTRPASRRHRR